MLHLAGGHSRLANLLDNLVQSKVLKFQPYLFRNLNIHKAKGNVDTKKIEHEVDDMNFVLDPCNLMKYEEILSNENFKEFCPT